VTRGSGEAALDGCVEAALKRLDDIQEGYRCARLPSLL
jgi:hypothetical protein